MPIARLARQIGNAFRHYRRNIELARDPDVPPPVRAAAWSRAAKQRSRIERQLHQLEGEHA